eukprot:7845223-Alexandrium_andersonii.AAC.1
MHHTCRQAPHDSLPFVVVAVRVVLAVNAPVLEPPCIMLRRTGCLRTDVFSGALIPSAPPRLPNLPFPIGPYI